MISDPEALVRSFYRALADNDPDGLRRVLDPAWESTPTSPAASGPGPEGYLPAVTWMHSRLSDLNIEPQDVLVAGDKVAIRLRTSATHSGELFGVPATGKRIEFDAMDMHRVHDGHIVQTWHLEDFFSVAGQLGLFGEQ